MTLTVKLEQVVDPESGRVLLQPANSESIGLTYHLTNGQGPAFNHENLRQFTFLANAHGWEVEVDLGIQVVSEAE